MLQRLSIKTFEQLTAGELYEILKARAAVFVIEQRILYLDMDGIDRKAVHIFLHDDALRVSAYARIFPGEEEGDIHMGRVLTTERGKGYGKRVVDAAMLVAAFGMNARRVVIDAQTSVVGFYRKLGFLQVSEEYIIEEIPHVKMVFENPQDIVASPQRERVGRIFAMEHTFRNLAAAVSDRGNDSTLKNCKDDFDALMAYYESPLWREDFEADEAGLLPSDLPRGVLSEDAVWNLAEQWKVLSKK